MYSVLSCLVTEHDFRLVLLAAIVCVATAITTFKIYALALADRKDRQYAWIVLTGVCAGSGIWATHFVAMLAYDGGFPTAYDPVATLGSLLVAISLAVCAFGIAVSGSRAAILCGGVMIGLSIGLMHFLGMKALIIPGAVSWNSNVVAVSWLCGIAIGVVSFITFHRHQGQRAVFYGASLLTLAICSLHFTAMDAVGVVPDPTVDFHEAALNRPMLAMATAGVFFIVLLIANSAVIMQRANLRFEAILREQNQRFAAALHHLPVGLSMFDAEHRLIMCNPAYREIYGLSDDDTLAGTSFGKIVRDHAARDGNDQFDPTDRDCNGDWLSTHAQKLAEGTAFTELQHLKDGRIIRVRVGPVANGGWVDVQEDITERSLKDAKIEHMARHDILTGLPNRAELNERLQRSLAASGRTADIALLFVDLDRFKEVNDTLGHRIGDGLLTEVAKRLRASVRKREFVARVGGDEFVVMITSKQASDDASALAARIIENVSAQYEIDGHRLSVGASVGIAFSGEDAMDGETLLARADLALYRAKSDGRGTFCFFEDAMDRRARRRRELGEDLRLALERGEFELNYQPIYETESGRLTAFEALLRWRHPQQGMISPANFIPVAEETGLIIPIGDWVLKEACKEAANWPSDIKVAVNLSPLQFKGSTLLPSVMLAIASSEIRPGRLELEITESALLQHSEFTLSALSSLRDSGVRIALDDFGTGFSSLSYLRSFPLDKIKIDRSFVSDLPENASSAAIVKAVCEIGLTLGLSVTAEGVETEAQLTCLKDTGCTEVQGYLLGRPMTAVQVKELVGTTQIAKVA